MRIANFGPTLNFNYTNPSSIDVFEFLRRQRHLPHRIRLFVEARRWKKHDLRLEERIEVRPSSVMLTYFCLKKSTRFIDIIYKIILIYRIILLIPLFHQFAVELQKLYRTLIPNVNNQFQHRASVSVPSTSAAADKTTSTSRLCLFFMEVRRKKNGYHILEQESKSDFFPWHKHVLFIKVISIIVTLIFFKGSFYF